LLAKLAVGKKYTKLDLSQAYHQLELSHERRKYTTINTHKGLYQYKRLTFGINSAVSIFQRTMENFLCRYVPDFAQIMSPLYQLLKKEAKCPSWGENEQEAFTTIKKALFMTPMWKSPYRLMLLLLEWSCTFAS
jgi:hypothetical protein